MVFFLAPLHAAPPETSGSFDVALGNVQRGADYFQEYCSECHSVSSSRKNKRGPSLYDVIGRMAASVPGYNYSTAMKANGRVWTAERLNEYLKDPKAMVPGTKMKFDGIPAPLERLDLVAFLSGL